MPYLNCKQDLAELDANLFQDLSIADKLRPMTPEIFFSAHGRELLHLSFSVMPVVGLDLISAVFERAGHEKVFRQAIPNSERDKKRPNSASCGWLNDFENWRGRGSSNQNSSNQ